MRLLGFDQQVFVCCQTVVPRLELGGRGGEVRSLQALSKAATDGREGLASASQLPNSQSCTWVGGEVGGCLQASS